MHSSIKNLIAKTLDIQEIILETPKNRSFGHYATPIAFNLAKTFKKSPMLLANEIAQKLQNHAVFSKVEVINGYINLTLSNAFLDSMAKDFLQTKQSNITDKPSILLEYVSANPTGPLHIGHARGAVFGDTLCRIGKFLGYDIKTEYYINDAGAQIQMLGLSILLAGKEHFFKQEVSYPQNCYRGDYIIEIAQSAKQHFGLDFFKDENIQKLGDFGKNLMLEEIKQNLKDIGITFDFFVSESALYSQWQDIFKKLQENDAIYEKEGKIWLKSEAMGDEKDRVIIRDNQEPTYLAGDIIYHYDKFSRFYDYYINIWGADHHGYINRIKASLKHLNFDDKKLEVVLAQMVSLLKDGKPYKMSKRAGNFILIKDIVEDIGADALRFIFVSKKLDTPLEFDVSHLKKQDSSNPVFYINYANARIHTLLQKANYPNLDNISLETLENQEALYLLFEAMQLQKVLENAFEERALQKVCEYLKNLASDFHSFYNANRILDSKEQNQLLKVCLVVSQSLTLGFGLLGIEAKTKM